MKKLISLVAAFATMATMAVTVSAAEPTIYLEVTGGTKAGETVTVTAKYKDFNVTPYNDDEGAGQQITGAQLKINIPGGVGSATQGEQFLRSGAVTASGFASGAPTLNIDITANTFAAVISSISDPMNSSGTIATLTMTLNKDVTEDLEFTFSSDVKPTIAYDTYVDWAWDGNTTLIDNPALEGATLKAPVVATTYTVTATSDVEVTGADISAPVAEGTKLNVAAKAKDGYTAKLLANGVEIAAGEYTVTGNVDFTVDYTAIVPANPHKYTLDDKGTCMKDTVKGIYYSLSVKNVADKLAIKVSDKVFEATGIPEVTGDTVSTLTYVILGVPDEIYNAVPVLGGVTSGETVFEAE